MSWLRGCLALALGCAAALAHADVREIAAAQVTVEGVAQAQETVLPYHWDRLHRGQAGRADFELRFDAPAQPGEPHGLFFPRIGNRAQLWLNGSFLAELGQVGDSNSSDFSKGPQYVAVPPGMLQRHNTLRVRIAADVGRRAGLSTVFVGPASAVHPLYQASFTGRVFVSMIVVVFGLLVALLALVLWLTQTDLQSDGRAPRDGLYLAAAAAEVFWALRVGDIAIESPPLPWPLWGVVVTAAFAGWICCVTLFCQQVAGWHRTRGNAWLKAGLLGLFLLSIAASSLSLRLGQPIYLTAWLGLANVFAVGYALFYMGAALRRPQPYQRLVAAAGTLNVLIGVRDWVVIRISGGYADSTWIRYSSVLFGLALGYIVLHRFREARAQAHNLMATLQQRVDAREQELASSYKQLEVLAREQERARERTTIMRDLHDGVGAHISSAIRQLQTGRADNAVVLQTLRESLDQLKLSVDAMNTPPGDVAGLLASLRYRLEPRFASSDIELQWMVDALEPVQRLDAPAMRHLQFLLFEALSNVLQHARASTLGIQASQAGGITRLRVVDNGRGFDAATAGSNGLRTMRDRAAALGAQLTVASEPGRTCVELGIPH